MRHKIRRSPVEKSTGVHALTASLSRFASRIRRADKWMFVILAAAVATRAALTLMRIRGEYPSIPGLSVNYWNDFYGYYVSWLRQVSSGVTPYKGCACGYTPLFLYTLLPFYLLGGAHAASIPITASDALTSIVVYKTVRKIGSRNAALVAGFGYALSPFALIYEGYMWMSSQPMTLFLALAVLSIESDRPIPAAAFLAVSVMFKQEALLVLPGFIPVYYVRFRPFFVKGIIVFSAIVLGVSLPFLALAPAAYISQLSYGVISFGVPLKIDTPPTGASAPYTLNSTFQALYKCSQTSMEGLLGPLTVAQCGSVPLNYYEVISRLLLLKVSIVAVYFGAMLIFALAPIIVLSIRKNTPSGFILSYSLTGVLIVYSFLVHGLYRYYYVPVYAANTASTKSVKTSLIVFVFELLGVGIPSEPVQVVLALLPVACLSLINSKKWHGEPSIRHTPLPF